MPYDGRSWPTERSGGHAAGGCSSCTTTPVVRADWSASSRSAEPEIQVVGEIGEARDVVDAVRVLEPDVVLLELRMPGLDGARLTSYVRAGQPERGGAHHGRGRADELLREAVNAGARGCVAPDGRRAGLARAVLARDPRRGLLTESVLRRFAAHDAPCRASR